MYPDNYNPVGEVFFRDQAEALAHHGHKVGVIAIVPVTIKWILKKKMLRFGLETFKRNCVTTFLFSFPVLPKTERIKQLLRKWIGLALYKRYVKSHGRPDIQHVHTFIAGGLAIEIEKRYGVPFVITEHSSGFEARMYSRFQMALAAKVFHKSRANIAVSRYFSESLSTLFSVSFIYIPNVVDTDFFNLSSGNNSDRKIRLLSIGNLIPWKQFDLLLNAFKIVCDRHFDASLVIGGDGPERGNLEKLAVELGIGQKVRFAGRLDRDQVRKEMQNCDIFVLTSKFETFGVVLIEAMACGKPVVSTRSCGPESIITDPAYGEFVDGNAESVAAGLIKVISRIESYDKNIIRLNAVNNFSRRAVTARLSEVYSEVCSRVALPSQPSS